MYLLNGDLCHHGGQYSIRHVRYDPQHEDFIPADNSLFQKRFKLSLRPSRTLDVTRKLHCAAGCVILDIPDLDPSYNPNRISKLRQADDYQNPTSGRSRRIRGKIFSKSTRDSNFLGISLLFSESYEYRAITYVRK